MPSPDRPVIVVVSYFCPFPVLHGNGARLIGLLTWLKSKGFHVSYILQPLVVEEPGGVERLAELVDRLAVVPRPTDSALIKRLLRQAYRRVKKRFLPGRVAAWLRNTADAIGGGSAFAGDEHIDRWCWPATCQAVRREMKRERPIAVISEYALMSKCLEHVSPPTLRVIDTVELFSWSRERFAVEGFAPPVGPTPQSERMAMTRADVLVAIQKNDASALHDAFPNKRVITVPHTYPQAGRGTRKPEANRILYVGSSNPFNVHGLRHFLDQAWQPLLRRVPSARLRIVGGVSEISSTDGERVTDDEHITYVGRVSDEELTREYQTAQVVINPQVAGTGLKIKCVEALSAGCPLVTNRAGADGLEAGEGKAFLVANDWPEFVDHVVRILTRAVLARELGEAARQFAEQMFSAEAAFSELDMVLSEHLRSLVR